MKGLDYRRATVVVYDPVHVNLRTTRYALHEMGFREIVSVTSADELRRRLDDDTPALVIAEAAPGDEIFRMVRRLRAGELGHNPFACVLLTSWMRDGATLKQAIGCGADDVIVRPFSTSFAEERIRALVKARKPFVVTSDYIGPDRRKDAQRQADSSAPPIEAPNVLQALVEDDDEALSRAMQWIGEARQTVDAERLRRLAMRIVVGVEVAGRELAAGRGVQFDITELERAAKELRVRFARARSREAARVSELLLETARALQTEDGFTPSNLALAKDLAMGAYAAFAGGESMERSVEEIERTVEALRKRLQPKAQMGGGADGAGELKRAAS